MGPSEAFQGLAPEPGRQEAPRPPSAQHAARRTGVAGRVMAALSVGEVLDVVARGCGLCSSAGAHGRSARPGEHRDLCRGAGPCPASSPCHAYGEAEARRKAAGHDAGTGRGAPETYRLEMTRRPRRQSGIGRGGLRAQLVPPPVRRHAAPDRPARTAPGPGRRKVCRDGDPQSSAAGIRAVPTASPDTQRSGPVTGRGNRLSRSAAACPWALSQVTRALNKRLDSQLPTSTARSWRPRCCSHPSKMSPHASPGPDIWPRPR